MRKSCKVTESVMGRGYRTVVLENDLISVTVLPDKGADIYSLIYKPRATDVLWKSPWGLKPLGHGIPSAGSSEEIWLEHYEGGWQEIFPNGGDACVYKGCHLNFHGEVSVSEWDYSLERHSSWVAAEFTVATRRSPFHIRRRLTVEAGTPVLQIWEKITSRAEEDMHFMWGHHPAFGAPFLDGHCWIQLPGATFQAHDQEMAPACRIPAGTKGLWPRIAGKTGLVDLSVVPPPSERTCEFGYLTDMDAGWYAITNRQLDFTFGLSWPRATFPYLWFWQELRGSFGHPWYGSCYVMAIEPFTSIPGTGLKAAIAAGTAPVLPAGSSIEVRLAARFMDGEAKISHLDLNEVVFDQQ